MLKIAWDCVASENPAVDSVALSSSNNNSKIRMELNKEDVRDPAEAKVKFADGQGLVQICVVQIPRQTSRDPIHKSICVVATPART